MNVLTERTLLIRKIENGTVIDHITAGYALDVLRILGIRGREGNVISIAMNVPSRKLGRKDIVKIEDRELRPEEVDRIALIAPQATINIIRDFAVAEKKRVTLPEVIVGIVKCANPTCISNSNEPVTPQLNVVQRSPLLLRCHYCGTIMEKEDVLKQF
ncbi:aspartate carbamoyltransferase regulatory subunit [Candidatus Bathyarchaeota archaeon]|nr:MAG: aspartate carbamoyltransferase regulatory subunit [Candidatus Bathyarchaeota archaeon]